jgi:hypothetical protein
MPARLYFAAGQLNRIDLLAAHPYAQPLIICLERYASSRFDR